MIKKVGNKYVLYSKDGSKKLVEMGCYGIGPSRLMGAIVELFNDEKGIIWPKQVSPFSVHLIQIDSNSTKNTANKIYETLKKQGIEVLFDDREDVTPGEKFADADLIGIPIRILISKKTLEKNSAEIKLRKEKAVKIIKIEDLSKFLNF